ncbi:26S proteasome non-ATPase regulatory subunit 5 [Chamberlinius hualienensis]
MDTLTELFKGLSINADKKEILSKIKTSLLSIPSNNVDNVLKDASIEPLIECLKFPSNEVIELTCDILRVILASYPADIVITNFDKELKDGLQQNHSLVKQLVLQQVLKCAEFPVELIQFLSDIDVFVKIVHLFGDSDLSVAQLAQKILVSLTPLDGGSILLFHPGVVASLFDVMATSSTVKYRVLEVVVSICKRSPKLLEKCVALSLLNKLIVDVDSNDVLVQLNAIEMLSDLATVSHGLQHLESVGVVRKLDVMLDKPADDIEARLLLPGLFKFFGHVGHLHPQEICERHRTFIFKVFDAVADNMTPSLVSVAIQTVGIIGLTIKGKIALDNLGDATLNVVKHIGLKIQDSTMTITALNAVESLMSVKVKDQTPELVIENILKKWFDNLSDNSMKLLLDICKHPFTEVRCAALAIFRSMANQRWAQRYMNDYPGFIEYLLDRSTEFDKKGKFSKYKIVETLANSSTVGSELGEIVHLRLRQYINSGPYFVQAETAVAFEGDD